VSPLRDDEPIEDEPSGSSSSFGEREQGSHRRRKRQPQADAVVLGQFELLEVLGTGEMGRVYRAVDGETECVVAVKTLHQHTPARQRALERGFDALSELHHPNLVQLYELFIEDDHVHFSQELVDGVSLDRYVFADQHSFARELTPAAVQRLIAVTGQICNALEFLHARHCVHRNLKPSNILVDDRGRVVLLDGALLGESELRDLQPFDRLVHNGIAYAAPELLTPGTSGTAVDMYALGAVLHELLMGIPPPVFDGTPPRSSPSPDEMPTGVPAPLREMVARLLSADASRRASPAKVKLELAKLHQTPAAAPRALVRQDDLKRLETAYERARAIRATPARVRTTLTVHAKPGSGTTTLVDTFCQALADRGIRVFRGRCYRGDRRPFGAINQLLDSIATQTDLREVAHSGELGALRTQVLARMFPSLADLQVDQLPPTSQLLPRDARQHAFESFGRLLTRALAGQPAVVWLDDAQWGDPDSFALLASLENQLAQSDIVLLLSYCSTANDELPLARFLSRDTTLDRADVDDTLDVELRPLSDSDARRFVEHLTDGRQTEQVTQHIATAAGSLWRLRESVSWPSEAHSFGEGLERLIARRGVALPRGSRRLLGVLATAGYPLDVAVAMRAAGLARGGLAVVQLLVNVGLIRRQIREGNATLELFHDKIHEAVMDQITSEQLAELHGRLAEALPSDDPAHAWHSLASGSVDAGSAAVVAAAHDASWRFAFERAAEGYQLVLIRNPAMDDRALHEVLALALRCAGRTSLAATHFARAAELATTQSEKIRLGVEAAQGFLRCGALHRGMQLLEELLQKAGVDVPPTSDGTSSGPRGLWSRVTETFTRSRKDVVLGPTVLDALWEATVHMPSIAPTREALWAQLHQRHAEASDDPARKLRALGFALVRESTHGAERRAQACSESLRSVAEAVERTRSRSAGAWTQFATAQCSLLRGQWLAAIKHAKRARRLFALHLDAGSWEATQTEACFLTASALRGDLQALAERLPSALADAVDREECSAANVFRVGHPALLWLCRDLAKHALDLAEAANAKQTSAGAPAARYQVALAVVPALLYLDHGARALEIVDGGFAALLRSPEVNNALAQTSLVQLSARAALATAAASPLAAREALLARVRGDADTLKANPLPLGRPYAALLEASIANLRADHADRDALLRQAAAGFEEADMALYAALARYALGDSDPIEALAVVNAERLLRSFAPGLG